LQGRRAHLLAGRGTDDAGLREAARCGRQRDAGRGGDIGKPGAQALFHGPIIRPDENFFKTGATPQTRFSV
jgi:hypothetical protein